MKVPPKRKGNRSVSCAYHPPPSLNESPSEKEGKFAADGPANAAKGALNESPSEKEGKYNGQSARAPILPALNESPSEKEGK